MDNNLCITWNGALYRLFRSVQIQGLVIVIVEMIILQSREQEQWYTKHCALRIIAHKSMKCNNTMQFQHLGWFTLHETFIRLVTEQEVYPGCTRKLEVSLKKWEVFISCEVPDSEIPHCMGCALYQDVTLCCHKWLKARQLRDFPIHQEPIRT